MKTKTIDLAINVFLICLLGLLYGWLAVLIGLALMIWNYSTFALYKKEEESNG